MKQGRRAPTVHFASLMDICHLKNATKFTPLEEKAPDGYMWSGERLTRKTAYFQARSSMARALEINGKARQAEGEARVV